MQLDLSLHDSDIDYFHIVPAHRWLRHSRSACCAHAMHALASSRLPYAARFESNARPAAVTFSTCCPGPPGCHAYATLWLKLNEASEVVCPRINPWGPILLPPPWAGSQRHQGGLFPLGVQLFFRVID